MTVFKINRAADGSLEIVDQNLSDGRTGQFFNVDFVNTVGETGMNCGGITAPNGRIWTAEEWFRTSTASINTGNTSIAFYELVSVSSSTQFQKLFIHPISNFTFAQRNNGIGTSVSI